MIRSLLTELSKQTEFIYKNKQSYEFQREVLVNRNNTQPKNNNQSDNNIIAKKINLFNKWQLLMKLFHNLNPSLKCLNQITLSIQMGGKNNLEKLKVAIETHRQRSGVLLFLARA